MSDTETPGTPARNDEAVLLAWLAEHDERCPVCRYELRGLVAPVCPECSARLRLGVGADNASIAPWLLAVIGAALALGFDGVVGLILWGLLALNPPAPGAWEPWATAGAFVLLGLLSLAALLVAIRRRTAIGRRRRRSQWSEGLTWFIAVGGLHAAVGLWFVLLLL